MLDLLIKNAKVVRPAGQGSEDLDIGIKDGKIARLEPNIPSNAAVSINDASGRLAFPGLVDAHMHVGIYAPLAEDARSESKAATMGGVTVKTP